MLSNFFGSMHLKMDYERFQFSPSHGFCSDQEPLRCIPGLEKHSALLHTVPTTFTPSSVESLPMFTEFNSLSLIELECAFVIHTMLNSAYYWHSSEPNMTIPANLAIPTLRLSRMLQRPPIMDVVGHVYNNWKYIDPAGPFHPSNIDSIWNFSGTRDEVNFIHYTNYVEALGVPAVEGIYQIPEFFEDKAMLEQTLVKIHESINKMTKGLAEQAENIDPDTFYFKIRKFSKSFYQGVTFAGENVHYEFLNGSSAVQTPLIKVIDAFLGIEHNSEFLTKTEQHLKKEHRELLEVIRKRDRKKLVEAVREHHCEQEWNKIVDELCGFRSEHIRTAEKFILVPSGNADKIGTAGSSLEVFLGKLKKDTESIRL